MRMRKGLIRDVFQGLQNAGDLKDSFDARTVPISDILPAEENAFGLHIYAITEGPGMHQAMFGKRPIPDARYEVAKGKVYATICTYRPFDVSVMTYVFQRTDGGLEKVQSYLHARA